jgi:hypothetical protein
MKHFGFLSGELSTTEREEGFVWNKTKREASISISVEFRK